MNKLFDGIKPFEWEELDGKTLQIHAGKQDGVMIVVGYDQETKDIFVLHEEITLPTLKPGDKVRHDRFPFPGVVDSISEIGRTAYCIFGPAPSGKLYATDFAISDLTKEDKEDE